MNKNSLITEQEQQILASIPDHRIRHSKWTQRSFLREAFPRLKDFNIEMKDIAEDMGFNKTSFSRLFSRLTGERPQSYRDNLSSAFVIAKQDEEVERVLTILDDIDLSMGAIKVSHIVDTYNVDKYACLDRFQRYVGQSFTDYITNLRLQEAKRLLTETALKIDEIANRVGLSSGVSLARLMKRVDSISPSEYRAQEKHPERVKKLKSYIDQGVDLATAREKSGFESDEEMYRIFYVENGYRLTAYLHHSATRIKRTPA